MPVKPWLPCGPWTPVPVNPWLPCGPWTPFNSKVVPLPFVNVIVSPDIDAVKRLFKAKEAVPDKEAVIEVAWINPSTIKLPWIPAEPVKGKPLPEALAA